MTSNQEQNNQEAVDLEKTNSEEIKIEEQSIEIEDKYKFGWSNYSEITNGRFAMLGFLAIILIELISQKSFLNWAGIF
ncbi:chlorophyll a-b binding domain-containing protein [Prochlorococcus sp. AH-716-I19]|nr:chlorophyll a-b binding domain-containing protein [Prochlorococcus sp. AH-716-I19]